MAGFRIHTRLMSETVEPILRVSGIKLPFGGPFRPRGAGAVLHRRRSLAISSLQPVSTTELVIFCRVCYVMPTTIQPGEDFHDDYPMVGRRCRSFMDGDG
jgi:hypothetical protein